MRVTIDGVILLDKPKGLSSNRALQKVRGIFNAKKAGHTGSLDPNATGLLPICLGQATKYSQYLLDSDKTYEADVILGVSTTTGDTEGEVTATADFAHVTQASLEEVLKQFTGTILQVPTMFSALKHQGQPLYKLARQGIEVERKQRQITIYELTLIDFKPPLAKLRVHCSKGTYIRTLAEDIGKVLNCGAHLAELRRLNVGYFREEMMVTLEALAEDPKAYLQPVCATLSGFEVLDISHEQYHQLAKGQRLDVPYDGDPKLVKIHVDELGFIGLGQWSQQGLAAKRLLSTADLAYEINQ